MLKSAASDVRDIGVFLAIYNLLWFLVSVPVVTAPPATAALYAITREMGYRNSVVWLDFFRMMRRYFWVGWRWALLNLAAVVIYAANLMFYAQSDPPADFLGRGFWTAAFILWLVVQMYCFPVLLEQERPAIRTALRNALVLVLRHPIYTLTLGIVVVVLIFASIRVAYFWIFFTVALLCFLYNRGVGYLVRLERGEEAAADGNPT